MTKRQLITWLEKLPMSDDSEVQVVLKPEQVGFLDDTQWWSIHHVEPWDSDPKRNDPTAPTLIYLDQMVMG